MDRLRPSGSALPGSRLFRTEAAHLRPETARYREELRLLIENGT